MVLFTPKKLTFKGSKKQHQILAQTAYYQAGKIVVQTILPEQPPVALIILKTLGTTCSTSADTYIPIENIFNAQSCSFLESRLVSLYGGKAASLLMEYEQRFAFPPAVDSHGVTGMNLYPVGLAKQRGSSYDFTSCFANGIGTTSPQPTFDSSSNKTSCYGKNESSPPNFMKIKAPCKVKKGCTLYASKQNASGGLPAVDPKGVPCFTRTAITNQRFVQQARRVHFSGDKSSIWVQSKAYPCTPSGYGFISVELPQQLRGQKLPKERTGEGSEYSTETNLINNVQSQRLDPSELTLLQNSAAVPRCFASPLPCKGTGLAGVHFSGRRRANGKARLVRTYSAGAGNNIFQSTLGNIEIQTATRLARIMVNYWNFYSLNKISLNSLLKKYDPCFATHQLNALHRKASINSRFTTNFNLSNAYPEGVKLAPQYLPQHLRSWRIHFSREGLAQLMGQKQKDLPEEKSVAQKCENGYAKRNDNIKVWGIKVKDKTPQGNIIYRVADPAQRERARRILAPLKWTPTRYAPYRACCTNRRFVIAEDMRERVHFSGATPQLHTPPTKMLPTRLAKLGVHFSGESEAARRNNLYFAIAQSKNSLKICENKNSSYNIQRLSIENIGNYSQLNNNNFQLINSIQFSNLQKNRFYPNWFRLYLPDMEATEFLKNVANYYFSLGLQTLTFPSTKSSYYFTPALGELEISTASPFLTFLNKNTQKDKYKLFISNIISYTYCPPSILINSTSGKYINSRFAMNNVVIKSNSVNTLLCKASASDYYKLYPRFVPLNNYMISPAVARGVSSAIARVQAPEKSFHIKDSSFTKVDGASLDPLNVPFSLVLENQTFPLNYNGFSIIEKELLYNALINSSFAKAFYLINQNRQLLDFFVDYLLRFQILRQHQILYIFSTLLLGCNKTA